jgi:flagellar hook-associated protein FlgK
MSGKIKKMILVPADASSTNIKSSALVPVHQRPYHPAFTNAEEQRVIDVHAEMRDVMNDNKLSDEEKFSKYIQLMRTYYMLKAKLNLQEQEPIPVQIISSSKTPQVQEQLSASVQPSTVSDLSKTQPVSGLSTQLVSEPSTSKTQSVISKQQPFAKTNIVKNIDPQIRSRAKDLLNTLTVNRNFNWNKTTGEIRLDNSTLPDEADLPSLVAYRIRQDMGQTGMSPPAYYNKFNDFLTRENIQTKKDTVSRSIKSLDSQIERDSAQISKRKKATTELFKQLAAVRLAEKGVKKAAAEERAERVGTGATKKKRSCSCAPKNWKSIKYLTY